MKKIFLGLLFLGTISLTASAQAVEKKHNSKKTKIETPNSELKMKKTSTPKQKVHNLMHPKRKEYNGIKVKNEAKKD